MQTSWLTIPGRHQRLDPVMCTCCYMSDVELHAPQVCMLMRCRSSSKAPPPPLRAAPQGPLAYGAGPTAPPPLLLLPQKLSSSNLRMMRVRCAVSLHLACQPLFSHAFLLSTYCLNTSFPFFMERVQYNCKYALCWLATSNSQSPVLHKLCDTNFFIFITVHMRHSIFQVPYWQVCV